LIDLTQLFRKDQEAPHPKLCPQTIVDLAKLSHIIHHKHFDMMQNVHDKHFNYYEIQLSFFTITATMMDMALNQ